MKNFVSDVEKFSKSRLFGLSLFSMKYGLSLFFAARVGKPRVPVKSASG